MRLTIVAHDVGGIGGMERMLNELISGLLGRGHDVTVVSRTCALPAHPRLTWARVPGPARPFPLAYPWFFFVGSLVTWRRRSGRLLTTGAIVANHADWSMVHFCHHAAALALGTSRRSRRSLAYRLSAWLAHRLSLAGERFCYRPGRTRGLIAVSKGVSEEVREHFPEMKVQTIPNGVAVDRFRVEANGRHETRARYGLTDADLVALFVGSEWEGKGLRFAIEAVARCDRWKLLVVGEGDFDSYGGLVASCGVPDRVVFAGAVDDPAPLYAASDAFVLPSAYETFSLVTYEAAASGLPLLVTPVHGVADLLRDDENGWFISRDGAEIARRLTALAAEGTLRKEMGSSARRAAGRFTWGRMVEQYAHLVGPQRSDC